MALLDWVTAAGSVFTGVGVAVAAFAIYNESKEAQNERTLRSRERTLLACERFNFEEPFRTAVSRIASDTARFTKAGTIDTAAEGAGSIRDEVSLLLNYLEAVAKGCRLGLYDPDILRSYFDELIPTLHLGFFAARPIISARWRDQPFPDLRKFCLKHFPELQWPDVNASKPNDVGTATDG